jgi:hypothetical protein
MNENLSAGFVPVRDNLSGLHGSREGQQDKATKTLRQCFVVSRASTHNSATWIVPSPGRFFRTTGLSLPSKAPGAYGFRPRPCKFPTGRQLGPLWLPTSLKVGGSDYNILSTMP